MALKTFNLDEGIYKEFSVYCKKHGISMSKKIENFIRAEMEYLKSGQPSPMKKLSKDVRAVEIEHFFKKYC